VGSDHVQTGAVYKKGAVVADCKIALDDSGAEPEMDVEIRAAFDVALDDIPPIPATMNRPVTDVAEDVAQ
jgi:hypothetical protein